MSLINPKAPRSKKINKRKARKAPAKKAKARAGAPKTQIVRSPSIGGQTSSKCAYPSRKMSPMVTSICHVGQKQRWVYNQHSDIVATVGNQQPALYAQAHQSILKKYADSYQNSTAARGQAVVGATTTLPIATARYVLQSIRTNHVIANESNAPCRLMIYDIVARRDTANTMDYTSPGGNIFNWQGGPVTAWEAGLEAATDTLIVPPIPLTNQYGAVPTNSAIFNKYFRIAKTTTIQLSVGSVHRHSVTRSYNALLDASVYGQEYCYALQGLTQFQMFVLVGAPASLLNDGLVDVGETSAPAKVSVLTDTEAVFTFGSAYCQTTTLVNPVYTDIPGGSTASIMSVALPAVVAVKTT